MDAFYKQVEEAVREPGNPLLEAEIRKLAERQGPITFAEFMELALYHPEHGYYRSEGEKLGPRGDFCTSPETHPVFGTLIGMQLEQMWTALGAPEEFTVVEVGAGNGSLCSQILRYACSSELHRHLRYVIVEKSAELAQKQREHLNGENLSGLARDELANVTWFEPTESSPLPSNVTGCYISNELLDAFPVHRVTMREGKLREIYVGYDDTYFVDIVGDLSTLALAEYFDSLGIALGEGAKAEVNLAALEWIHRVADSLSAGFVITLDYGFPAEDLFSAKRSEGTLMSYFKHTCGVDPYARVGRQDMTTHVDFTSLISAGRTAGLKFAGLVSQSDFLTNLGLDGCIAALGRSNLSPAVYYDNKFAMRRLVTPDGLGKFKVLVQQKGLVEAELDCFNPCNDRKRELITGKRGLEVPLLMPSTE